LVWSFESAAGLVASAEDERIKRFAFKHYHVDFSSLESFGVDLVGS
jgi:hypothetical protein